MATKVYSETVGGQYKNLRPAGQGALAGLVRTGAQEG